MLPYNNYYYAQRFHSIKHDNINSLLIEKGSVHINKYDYGFIGGCCGLIDKNLLLFNGDLSLHSDFDKIKKFLYDNGINYTIEVNANTVRMINQGTSAIIWTTTIPTDKLLNTTDKYRISTGTTVFTIENLTTGEMICSYDYSSAYTWSTSFSNIK